MRLDVNSLGCSPGEVVRLMKSDGWLPFTTDGHTRLWKKLDAKDPIKGYSVVAMGRDLVLVGKLVDAGPRGVRLQSVALPARRREPDL
jgi:hypothetical protein